MMKNDENTAHKIEEAFNSIVAIQRATPKPYLLTRINTRLSNQVQSTWEKVALFISRPALMVLGVCLILAINISVILVNNSSKNNAVAERAANTIADEDEYSTTIATIDNIETPEP
jgi:hypothetical protein